MNKLQTTYKTAWNTFLLTLGIGVIIWLLYINMLVIESPDLKSFVFFMTILVLLALFQWWLIALILLWKNVWYFFKNREDLIKNCIEVLEFKAKKKEMEADKFRHKAMKIKFRNLNKKK